MGNANSTIFQTNDCHDIATRRQNNRASFEAGVHDLRIELKPGSAAAPLPLRLDAKHARPRIVVRKRPMFENEREHDFDVLSSQGGADVWGDGHASAMWVTRGMLCADAKTMYCENHSFYADAVFDEGAGTAEVYEAAVRPLVDDTFGANRGSNTVLCFGQTGSGKTYTLSGIIEALRRDMPQAAGGWPYVGNTNIHLTNGASWASISK